MKNMTKIQDVRSMFILISDKLKLIHTLILHVLTNCGHDSSSVKVWHIHIDQGRAIESSLSTSIIADIICYHCTIWIIKEN